MFGLRLGLSVAAAVGLAALSSLLPASSFAAAPQFNLKPNPPFLACVSADPNTPPTAVVTVERGAVSDLLHVEIHGVKPDREFTVFSVERTNLTPDGRVDPAFKNFGLAWYQTDINSDDNGDGAANIRTILVDRPFGFDPDANLKPTNTFNIGLWFNDPNDAVPCGFDASKPTPFNSIHQAGPTALISVPDSDTNLGPLCFDPRGNGTCKPQ